MRQLAIPVQISIAAPIKHARADVSPMDPGMVPIRQLLKENIPPSANNDMVASLASAAGVPTVLAKCPNAVAPE